MGKTIELLTNMTGEMARNRLAGLEPKYTARQLEKPEKVEEARRLAIGIFASLNKIPKEEINEQGLLEHDPFLEKSTFFGVDDQEGELLAATRLIWRKDTTVDDMRLPTEEIDEEYSNFLHGQQPGKIAEIGSLAKREDTPKVATLTLLREVFDFAVNNDIEYFVCGLEPKLYPTYKRMFGGALSRMHEDTVEFPGIQGEQVPLMINIHDALSYDFEKMQANSLSDKAVGTVIRMFFNAGISTNNKD